MKNSDQKLKTVLLNNHKDMFYLKIPFSLLEEENIEDIINSVKENMIDEWKEYKKLQNTHSNKSRTAAFVLEKDS